MALFEPYVIPGFDWLVLKLLVIIIAVLVTGVAITISSIVGLIRAVRRRRRGGHSIAAVVLATIAAGIKVLQNGKLARAAKFSFGSDYKIVDTGIVKQNNLGVLRVLVPAQIVGEQDGQWDRTAYKSHAFFGIRRVSFTTAPASHRSTLPLMRVTLRSRGSRKLIAGTTGQWRCCWSIPDFSLSTPLRDSAICCDA